MDQATMSKQTPANNNKTSTNESSSTAASSKKGESSEGSNKKVPQQQQEIGAAPPTPASTTTKSRPSPSLHPQHVSPMIPPYYPMSAAAFAAFPATAAASPFGLDMGFHHARRMIAIEQEQQRLFAWRMNQLQEHRIRMEKRALQQRRDAEERLRKKRRRLNPSPELIEPTATTASKTTVTTKTTVTPIAVDNQTEGKKKELPPPRDPKSSYCFPLPPLSEDSSKKENSTVWSLDEYEALWKAVSIRADKLFGEPKDSVNEQQVKQEWIRHYFAKGLDSNAILRKRKRKLSSDHALEGEQKMQESD